MTGLGWAEVTVCVAGKTVWQCAQCHYSSKLRYTVKEHVETHISGEADVSTHPNH